MFNCLNGDREKNKIALLIPYLGYLLNKLVAQIKRFDLTRKEGRKAEKKKERKDKKKERRKKGIDQGKVKAKRKGINEWKKEKMEGGSR